MEKDETNEQIMKKLSSVVWLLRGIGLLLLLWFLVWLFDHFISIT